MMYKYLISLCLNGKINCKLCLRVDSMKLDISDLNPVRKSQLSYKIGHYLVS